MSNDCRMFVRVSLPVVLLLGVVTALDPMLGETMWLIAFILTVVFLLAAAIVSDQP